MPKDIPIVYAVMDVETTEIKAGERPRTLFWGYADEKIGYRRFNSTEKFTRFLQILPPRNIIHHFNYDVIQLLRDGYHQIEFNRSHNGKFILTKLAGRHTALNSGAIYPVGLGEIMKAFGYDKTPLDQLEKRNYEDCVLGLECFLKLDQMFVDLIGQSPLRRHTIAATTFAAAEAFAGKMPKDLSYVEAYRGGRVEVFDTREHLAKRYDIKSSYPAAFFDCPEESELLTVRVNSKDHWGPLACKDYTERLVFPSGQFESYVYRDVLDRYILPNAPGLSVTVLDKTRIDLRWLQGVRPLIQKLYILKNAYAKNSAQNLLGKLGLNSCYGRIGLKGLSERCELLPYFPQNRNGATVCQLGWKHYLVWYNQQHEPRSNFPLASYITDNGRGRLYEGIVKTTALYCDTDAVDTDTEAKPGTIGNDLGNWAFDKEERFKAGNLKDYRRGNQVWPHTGEPWQWGQRHVKGGEVNLQWTLKLMASGEPARRVEKTFSGELKKRKLLPDGTTIPLEYGKDIE